MNVYKPLIAKWIVVLTVLALCIAPSAAFAAEPLSLTKAADNSEHSLGDTVTYTFVVVNTSTDNVSNISLTDDKIGSIALTQTMLMPGENITATGAYTVRIIDFPGPLTNVAVVKGVTPNGDNITAAAQSSITLKPYSALLSVTKTSDKTEAAPHDTVTYNYTIFNSGEVAVSDITLEDDKLGVIALDKTTLAPGENITATAFYTITIDDLPGPIVNTAVVRGNDPNNIAVSANSNSVSVSLSTDKTKLTKFEILKLSGVPGRGISKAPGLQKPFNSKSEASDHAGKKDKKDKKK